MVQEKSGKAEAGHDDDDAADFFGGCGDMDSESEDGSDDGARRGGLVKDEVKVKLEESSFSRTQAVKEDPYGGAVKDEEVKDEKKLKSEKLESPDIKAEDESDDDSVKMLESDDDSVQIQGSDEDVKLEHTRMAVSDSESDDEAAIFEVPTAADSLAQMREHFVAPCLEALFARRVHMWAKGKVDAFFQDVYYKREAFTPEQQTRIEAWQARIKTLQRAQEKVVGEANNPLEAHRPVVDSRAEVTTFDADASAWASKQFGLTERTTSAQIR